MHALVIALTLLGGVQKGGKLYVKGNGVNMTDKADGTGAKTALKAGDEVTWQGPDAKNKSMQAIELRGKKGFVPMVALTPNRPQDEVASADGKAMSAAAFASSPAPLAKTTEDKAAAARLQLLRASSEAQKARVAEHVKAAGLGGDK